MDSNKNKTIDLISGLYIVATPIGNLNDISNRAIQTLQAVDLIVCENPKHSLKLLNKQGIKKKLLSLHDYNEKKIINKLSKVMHNTKIALISDSGSPLISDPGHKLVKYFLNNKVHITTIPGSSSIISALQLSGLPINNFAFYGFVPKQKSKKKQFFTKIKDIGLTSVIFVSAINLTNTIHCINDYIGEKEISVCKEITKYNEKIYRGTAKSILNLLDAKKILLKGEYTLVLSEKIRKKPNNLNIEIKRELSKLLKKYNLTDAVKIVHSLTGISRKDIYRAALKLKND